MLVRPTPTVMMPAAGSRAELEAGWLRSTPPVLCHHHHNALFYDCNTPPSNPATITHDDALTSPHHPRTADRRSDPKLELKTFSVDGAGHSPEPTNPCHDSIAAGSKANASKPSSSADTPSAGLSGHLLSKLPFPRQSQHPDTAPQHITVSKHDVMLPAVDRKSTRLNSSHSGESRMPSSA